MKWKKLGLVYCPDGTQEWARTHGMVPTPVFLPDLGVIRIFMTCCDSAGIGRPGFIDVSPDDPTRVISPLSGPLMDIGLPGTFDESGVLGTSVVQVPDGRLFLYYVGFEIGTKIRYRLLSGVAISEDNGSTFVRHSTTPVLERNEEDLYFRGGPYVIFDGGRFRMWYVGGSHWLEVGGKAMPEYRIKYIESEDGEHWHGKGQLVMDITGPDEHGFGRPWIMPNREHGYEMYYSIRRKSLGAYRMGFATSPDGLAWDRKDSSMGMDVGPDEFDSHAIMYAAVIEVNGRTYCYYNGNDFGRDGFAVAVREEA